MLPYFSGETYDDKYTANKLEMGKLAYRSYVQNYFKATSDDRKYISKNDVERFAKYMGVHPGIVVGRLQHDGRIAHSSMIDLRQKYKIIIRN